MCFFNGSLFKLCQKETEGGIRKMDKKRTEPLYLTMWRWHFYAGLFFAPLLLILAVSGAIYIFKPQIENIMYQDYYKVDKTGDKLLASEQIDSVLANYQGSIITKYRPGEDVTRSA
jgi:uncharacterized iron-regulated membrane protein